MVVKVPAPFSGNRYGDALSQLNVWSDRARNVTLPHDCAEREYRRLIGQPQANQ